MTKRLKVWGDRDFIIEIPDDAKITFGPWSPPIAERGTVPSPRFGSRVGTLRVYKGTKATENVIAVFSGVAGFRDMELEYEEEPQSVMEIPTPWSVMDKDERQELADMVASSLASSAMDKAMDPEEEVPF